MEKELPNQVFDKQYDNFYLFTELDVIFNNNFYEKLIFFMEKINSNKMFFKIEDSIQGITSIAKKMEYVNPSKNDLIQFYEMELEVDNKKTPIHCLNHFIFDNSYEWQLYISLENELSIFGCDNSIKSLFENVFKPYEEEKLNVKYKIIGDMFSDEKSRELFVNTLQKTYNF